MFSIDLVGLQKVGRKDEKRMVRGRSKIKMKKVPSDSSQSYLRYILSSLCPKVLYVSTREALHYEARNQISGQLDA